MSEKFPVLVTGATGKLGTKTCEALLRHGFDVRATDQKVPPEFEFETELGDLKDEYFVHRLMRGVRAVVHLGVDEWLGAMTERYLNRRAGGALREG